MHHMPHRCEFWIAVLAIGQLLLAGCGTASHSPNAAVSPHGNDKRSTRKVAVASPDPSTRKQAEAHAHYAAGVIHDTNDESDLALEEFYKAAMADPGNEPLVLELSRRFLQAKQTEKALEVLTNATAMPNASGILFARLGMVYSQAGKNDLAISANRTAIKKMPRSLAGHQNLFQAQMQNGQSEEALKTLEHAAKQPETDAGFLIGLAELFNNFGRTVPAKNEAIKPMALDALTRAAKLNPANVDVYLQLGRLAFEEKKFDQAAEYFQKTLLFRPDFQPTYHVLARVQIILEKNQEALATLEKARAKFPENFLTEFLSGLAYSGRKEYAESVKHFTAAEVIARATDPKQLDDNFYFQLGAVYERNGDYQQSEIYLQKCLEISPDFAAALNWLGYMWADRGIKLDQAREMIEKAVKLEPKSAEFLDSLGWVLFKLDQPQPALEQMLKAVELAEKPDATLYDHLGDIYMALKQPEKAREAWRKSLSIEPSEQIQKKLNSPTAK